MKPNDLDVLAAIPRSADRKKLSKRALELLEMLECQSEVCVAMPPKINVRAILCLLAGSQALTPSLHTSFAKAGFVASKKQIKGGKK